MAMLRYYFFCVRWLWKNRKWNNTRQKFKAMDNDYVDYLANGFVRQYIRTRNVRWK